MLSLGRRCAVEGVGTALLLAGVVGSGIMAERLAGGNVALALLANALATGGILVALISAFGPLSGAHFNPVVTLAGRLPWRETGLYMAVQVVGAILGVALAHGMFGLPLFSASMHARNSGGEILAEGVATFGLLLTIRGCGATAAPLAVAGYIVAAYWFTSSTSFANPAVTIARSMTDTFSGIRPADAPAFIAAQAAGAAVASVFFRWLEPSKEAA